MIQINEELVKKLMAIADANDDDDYIFHIKHNVIEQLKNDNGFDDDALYDFLREVDELKNEILEDFLREVDELKNEILEEEE